MLKKVEIKVSGDSSYLPGEMIDRIKFDITNEKLVAEGKKACSWRKSFNGYYKSFTSN